ncbi:MAG: GNAT family N-acetyltransferase [Acidimicrobiales bacterium]
MPRRPYVSEALTPDHDLSDFRCGVAELDRWLTNYALQAASNRTARVFVWPDGRRVVAYYSLTAHQVQREALSQSIRRGNPNNIPAILLGKFALARHLQSRGLGSELLVDALERVVTATQNVAARLVVVDADNEDVVGFYEHFGFLRTGPESNRLVRKISDVAHDLA